MPTIKFNIAYEDYKRLKEATDYSGATINEELYTQIIESFLAKRQENIIRNATNPDRKKEKEVRKAMASAYKQVENQKRKERKGKPAEAIKLCSVSEDSEVMS